MVGFGYDSHKFKDDGSLIIGGITITTEFGVIAHSDGDVLVHSLIDALLGACGLGDIGELFSDEDDIYKDIDSMILLERVVTKIHEKGYKISNIDSSILLEKIKLRDYKQEIRKNIAKVCGIGIDIINVKAKTNEGMGFVGRNEGIACFSVCELIK